MQRMGMSRPVLLPSFRVSPVEWRNERDGFRCVHFLSNIHNFWSKINGDARREETGSEPP